MAKATAKGLTRVSPSGVSAPKREVPRPTPRTVPPPQSTSRPAGVVVPSRNTPLPLKVPVPQTRTVPTVTAAERTPPRVPDRTVPHTPLYVPPREVVGGLPQTPPPPRSVPTRTEPLRATQRVVVPAGERLNVDRRETPPAGVPGTVPTPQAADRTPPRVLERTVPHTTLYVPPREVVGGPSQAAPPTRTVPPRTEPLKVLQRNVVPERDRLVVDRRETPPAGTPGTVPTRVPNTPQEGERVGRRVAPATLPVRRNGPLRITDL